MRSKHPNEPGARRSATMHSNWWAGILKSPHSPRPLRTCRTQADDRLRRPWGWDQQEGEVAEVVPGESQCSEAQPMLALPG